MSKPPENHRKRWSDAELAQLQKLANGNTPTRVAALKLHRTPEAIQAKAAEQGISLKPNNQSPYGSVKKSK